ncbi:MAG TPA: LemA family protein, partial [Firmicutes bacterium]|nr:LemA family protein [Bacillota bacterium]HCF88736.1 LemA family protein [Bacillota bacterium]
MKKGCLFAAVGVGIIVLLAIIFVSQYIGIRNHIVTADEGINGAWAQVDNVLQRRADLIPNLVATVKGYAAHESEVFTAIADARSKMAGAGTIDEKAEAATEFEGALSRLLVVIENYPQLKADASFIRLQDELAGTENRLTVERMRYNDLVRDYNAYIRRFPQSIIAGMMNAIARTYFE